MTTIETKRAQLQCETSVDMETPAFNLNEKEFQTHSHTGASEPVQPWY